MVQDQRRGRRRPCPALPHKLTWNKKHVTKAGIVRQPDWNVMSVRLTLICHATTAAVRAAAFPTDEPLDAQGCATASLLASVLPGELRRIDKAWTSPARRARETAALLQLQADTEPALRELDHGRWAGRTFAEIQTTEPDALGAWIGQPDAAPHGGESVAALLERVGLWLDGVSRQQGRIVAVTHAAVIRAAMVVGIGAPAASFWRIDIAPLCRVSLQGNAANWTLRSMQR
jgi:broad specificity phosphatase PhoE